MNFNQILIKKKGLALLPTIESNDPLLLQTKDHSKYILTLQEEFVKLGYVLTPALAEALTLLTLNQLKEWYLETLTVLKYMKGVKDYSPMYPNFPEQVMEMDVMELFCNAIIHYWTKALPIYEKGERLPLFEDTKVSPLDLGDRKDLAELMARLMSSKSSISFEDKDYLKSFLNNAEEHWITFPESIPHKEIFALVSSTMFSLGRLDRMSDQFKTTTDILRFAVGLSDGDISLALKSKFRKFSRPERRMLLSLINKVVEKQIAYLDNMWQYRGKWLRLGERLHPGEYKNRYKSAANAFHHIRNLKVTTFNSKVEKAIKENDLSKVTAMLATRPGLFVRRLAEMARMSANSIEQALIYTHLQDVIDKVSTPVLLQLTAFLHQDSSMYRAFMPKGEVSKIKVIPNNQEDLPNKFKLSVITIVNEALSERFSHLEPLGKVYLDEELRSYTVPLTQRNASKALHTIPRGSVLPIDGKTIRFFLWWKDGKSTTDLDLSATAFTDDWNYKTHISYTHLRDKEINACHSGDITSAPAGASEFIDIDVAAALEAGVRYIIPSIHSFTSQPYCDLPECFMGWMSREEPNSGEIYEPKTVEQKIDLTANTTIAIPMVIDIVNGTLKWLDLSLLRRIEHCNNIEANGSNIAKLGFAFTEKEFPNLYDLLELHSAARGEIIEDKDEADTVFSIEEGTPYNTDTLLAEFL